MAARTFRSRLDRWLVILVAAGLVAVLGVIVALATQLREPLLVTVLVLASMLVGGLSCGSSSVVVTWSPLSSPAGSLECLLIRYGNNRRIMVSPADRRGFLRAVGKDLEAPPG